MFNRKKRKQQNQAWEQYKREIRLLELEWAEALVKRHLTGEQQQQRFREIEEARQKLNITTQAEENTCE